MRSWRKLSAVLLLSGASAVAGFFGSTLVRDIRPAQADDVVFAKAEQTVQAAREQLATVQDTSAVFRDVHQAVGPSVVEIQVRKTIRTSGNQPFDEQQLRRFFHDFGDNQNGQGNENTPDLPLPFGGGPRTYEQIGTGSGVIVDASNGVGYIVTNNHVVGGVSNMTITLADGRVIKNGKVVGADPNTDIAVVEIKADHLIAARWGDSSKLQVGDRVLAFGAPFGYVGSMTHGIVSALHRQAGILGKFGYEDFIQTDAPINPGNSGGPLVDIRGDVVGINAAIATEGGGFQGIGFAVPSSVARHIYMTLREHGKVTRGWLGVSIVDVSKMPEVAHNLGYTGTNGVLVQGVMKNAPAEGQLQPGDVITAVNGKQVNDSTELRTTIAMAPPNQDVTLGVWRNGKQQDVKIKLGEQPTEQAAAPAQQPASEQTLGMRLSDLTNTLSQRYGVSGQGAVVTAVEPNSAAAQAGIKAGDVITQVGGQKITNANEAKDALSKADLAKGVRLMISNREGTEMMFLQSAGR